MSITERFKLIPAVYLVLTRGNEVLLSRRANTGYQDGKWCLVAGHLDGDELATAALAREACEEIGISIKATDLSLVHTTHRLGRNDGEERVDFFFRATEWTGDIINLEPEKCGGLEWFALDSLPDDTIILLRMVLTDIAAGVIYSEYETEPV